MAKKHPAETASKTMAFETLEKKVLLSSGEEPEVFQLEGEPTTSPSDPDATEEHNATGDDETVLGRTDCCDLLTGECYVAPQQDAAHAACYQQLEEMDEHLLESDPLAASNGGTPALPPDVILVPTGPSDEADEPIGDPQGIYPGRVVWVHDPESTSWDGVTGYHWEDRYTNQAVVQDMFSRGIRWTTGETDDAAGWDALFRHFNDQRGLGDVGYRRGERVVVKINMNENEGYNSGRDNNADLSPAVVFALLDQLVNYAGVPQQDIYVYDSIRVIPHKIYDKVHPVFPDVHYVDRAGRFGRERVQPSDEPIHLWSQSDPDDNPDYLPKCVVESKYMINLAIVKKHGLAGITGCAKNHFGSFMRRPDDRGHTNVHTTLARNEPTMGSYRALVDLMGHEHLGGKTILNILDGTYGGWNWGSRGSEPTRWGIAPFNDDWLSSLFFSQDAVAIDSVLYDFIKAEDYDYFAKTGRYHGTPGMPAVLAAADDYLHEAARCGEPGARNYDPEGDGTMLSSLGVHEHWDSVEQKQYSRDRQTGPGIELVREDPNVRVPGDANGDGRFDSQDLTQVLAAGKYNTGVPATFAEGDWDDDGFFDVNDLVFVLVAGTYRR